VYYIDIIHIFGLGGATPSRVNDKAYGPNAPHPPYGPGGSAEVIDTSPPHLAAWQRFTGVNLISISNSENCELNFLIHHVHKNERVPVKAPSAK
jgi:hypothetical protein